MKAELEYYKEIRRAYPKTMSKDQFYRVAHISKATALHLLQNGLVPCKDSGKKTRRYTIKTNDVINYLQNRLLFPEKFLAADGWYEKRSGNSKSCSSGKDPLLALTPEQSELLRRYFEQEMIDYDDLIDVEQLSDFIGYGYSTIIYWCAEKKLKSFNVSNKYLIPKICAYEYLASPKAHCIRVKSFKHRMFIQDFFNKHINT